MKMKQGLKRKLVVSKRLIEVYIWLLVKYIIATYIAHSNK